MYEYHIVTLPHLSSPPSISILTLILQSCHYIGLDNNDTPTVSYSSSLSPGVAFCLEPGLYVGLITNQLMLITSLTGMMRFLRNYDILVSESKIRSSMWIIKLWIF